MALTYSLDGLRQRSYRVWMIYPSSGTGESGYNNLKEYVENYIIANLIGYQYGSAFTNLSELLAADTDITDYSERLGECRKDSISLVSEDGNSIEGNEVGTLILDKNCSFAAELLNATPGNIELLNDDVESQVPVYIILEEIDGRTKDWDSTSDPIKSKDTHEIIFIGINNALILNMVENHVGGGISTVTINGNDTVARISDFRKILDVPYDLEDQT